MNKFNAFKEAVADTAVGMATNVPANFILVSLAFHYGWSATLTTVIMTAWFTCMAIVRKMIIRLSFEKHYRKKAESAFEVPK